MRAVPRLCEFYPGICFTTEEKARENPSQGKKNLSQVKKNLNQRWAKLLDMKHCVGHVRLRVFATRIEKVKMIPR